MLFGLFSYNRNVGRNNKLIIRVFIRIIVVNRFIFEFNVKLDRFNILKLIVSMLVVIISV